ncbi:MAG: Holliday junction resolvase RuvX [Rickettsiales bacterium]|nr:Holliday junction resolvase RuvX [Rickettsiales bacterium]
MIVNNLEEFKKLLKENRRIIGLDVGRKTIGVALSDKDKNIATPKFIIARKSIIKDVEVLVKYITENDVCAVVSGLPLNSNGEKIEVCNYIVRFVEELNKKINLPIFFENEFLSSFIVEDFMIDEMGTKSRKVKTIVDKSAASVILQDTLNKIRLTK